MPGMFQGACKVPQTTYPNFLLSSSEGISVELPYSRSLFKTMDVERRNVDYVIADLMKPDVMPVSKECYFE